MTLNYIAIDHVEVSTLGEFILLNFHCVHLRTSADTFELNCEVYACVVGFDCSAAAHGSRLPSYFERSSKSAWAATVIS